MIRGASVVACALIACAAFAAPAACTDTVVDLTDDAAADTDESGAGDEAEAPDADVDAGYCFNRGDQVDAAAATIFGNCVPHPATGDTMCVEYAGIGVSFAEAANMSNCTSTSSGTWSHAAPCARTNVVGGCRQLSPISNLCETVITYWYFAGGEAGTTSASVMAKCAAQGNAAFVSP